MYNGIGLNTPRGSGTSGYITKNLSTVRRTKRQHEKDDPERDIQRLEAALARPPNKEILDHKRKREIEVKCLEKRDKLEDQGFTEEEIEKELASYRQELAEKAAKAAEIKEHKIHLDRHGRPKNQDTHSMAAMNQSRNDRFKSALGISADFKEGTSHQLLDASKNKKDKSTNEEPEKLAEESPSPPLPVAETPGPVESTVPEAPAEKTDAAKVYEMLDDSDSDESVDASKKEERKENRPEKKERSKRSSSPDCVPKRYRLTSNPSKSRRRRSPSSASSASGSSDSDSSSEPSPPRHRSSRRRDISRSRSKSRNRDPSRSRSPSVSRDRGTARRRRPSRSRSRSTSVRRRSRDRYRRSRDRDHRVRDRDRRSRDRDHRDERERSRTSPHHRSSRHSHRSHSRSKGRSHSKSRSYSRDRTSSRR